MVGGDWASDELSIQPQSVLKIMKFGMVGLYNNMYYGCV